MSAQGGQTRISGGAALLSLALGASLTSRFIVYGEIGGFLSKPTVEGLTPSTKKDPQGGFPFLGPGLAYYLMPQNVYFSGSLLFHAIMLDTVDSGEGQLSNTGVGLSLGVGKEWGTGNYALGVGAKAFMGWAGNRVLRDSSGNTINATWSTFALALLLSATYN
jgi:hypothetical protein